MIHLCLGTKAQYIKMAPVVQELAQRNVAFRLIDMGQHGQFSRDLREQLGIPEPDVYVGGKADVVSTGQAVLWALKIMTLLLRPRYLRSRVFGDQGGICVVHGDTPSTLLSAWMGRRAGLRTAHVEAGLTTGSFLEPFPEEIIRRLVTRMSDILFAPTADALEWLDPFADSARIVNTDGNTGAELLPGTPQRRSGPAHAVVTCHRVENLRSKQRLTSLVNLVDELSRIVVVDFVLHDPTDIAMEKFGLRSRLESLARTQPLMRHGEFLALLSGADLVITDGGSIQEECALLGVPTLLWRNRTERPDGIGENVVISHFDSSRCREFIHTYEKFRRSSRSGAFSPSRQIVGVLIEEDGSWAVLGRDQP